MVVARGERHLGHLSALRLPTGRPVLQHRHAGVWQAAGLLLVAGPDRLLVDERSESGSRRNSLGDVVWRRKVLGGERARRAAPAVVGLRG